MKRFSRGLRPFILAGIVAVICAALIIVIFGSDTSKSDVVLDEPGIYQEPGIATNAPIEGKLLGHADVLDLADAKVNTATLFTSGRPVVINYWFSNCQPCKREMPALEAAHIANQNRVDFVGINTQDSAEITTSFAADIGVTYRLLRDPNAESVVANGISTYPTTLFVNAAGVIIKQIAGEMSAADITSALIELGIS